MIELGHAVNLICTVLQLTLQYLDSYTYNRNKTTHFFVLVLLCKQCVFFLILKGARIMAETKKVTVKPAAKAVAKKEEVKETKVEAAKEVKVEAAKEVKAAPAKKVAEKKETVKKEVAKKAPAKKETVKKETKAATKKAEVKADVQIQFSGKAYTTDELVKIAKDVWKYDLGKKEADFKTVELYVKPEESLTYYVINGEVSGSFAI